MTSHCQQFDSRVSKDILMSFIAECCLLIYYGIIMLSTYSIYPKFCLLIYASKLCTNMFNVSKMLSTCLIYPKRCLHG